STILAGSGIVTTTAAAKARTLRRRRVGQISRTLRARRLKSRTDQLRQPRAVTHGVRRLVLTRRVSTAAHADRLIAADKHLHRRPSHARIPARAVVRDVV